MQVLFSVYIIEDNHKLGATPTASRDFNIEGLKAEAERLRLPSQTFKWAVHTMPSSAEPALANAVAASLRSALGGDAAHPTRRTTFIDSATLANQLRSGILSKESGGGSHGVLEVRLCFAVVPLVILPKTYQKYIWTNFSQFLY